MLENFVQKGFLIKIWRAAVALPPPLPSRAKGEKIGFADFLSLKPLLLGLAYGQSERANKS
ncbi:MAG: hypothetical protein R2825_00865 [Saprospiraceae bacterium]